MSAGRIALAALAAVATGVLGAVGKHAYDKATGRSGLRSKTGEPLSAKRKTVEAAMLEVIPSRYPEEKFKRIAPSYKPEDPAWREMIQKAGANPDTYTTCGEGTRYGLAKVGIDTKGGLASIRDIAQAHGAWVEAGGDRRPKMGDAFLLGDGKGAILHTGLIKDASGPVWTTWDAGQGGHPNQAAAEVQRPYDASAVTLGGPAGPRKLLGWMDIDKMPGSPERA